MRAHTEFEEHIYCPEDDEFISSAATVSVHDDGYWVTVCTDDYEGNAMMSLAVARKLLDVLPKALAIAEARHADYLKRRAAA